MTTLDTVFLIITASLLSLFFLLASATLVMIMGLLKNVKRVVAKADSVVDSVENAADVFKDAQGRMAFFKLVRNIIKLVNRSHK